MNPDTAEMAIADAPSEGFAATLPANASAPAGTAPGVVGRNSQSAARAPSPQTVRLGVRTPAWLVHLRADPARMVALRESWRALLLSRALVWVAGVGSILTLGLGRVRGAFDPPGVTHGFGALGDLLAGPAARWDASWYLVIAHYGYRPDLGSFTSSRTAFFPLYPLGVRSISDLGVPPVLAGVLLSLTALLLALYGLHRLMMLELAGPLGRALGDGTTLAAPAGLAGGMGDAGEGTCSHLAAARLAVLLTAFAPMAFYLSAVYSESLYLALSIGVFWCARQGRWGRAAALGGLAAATRSAGVVLVLPVLILYLYGPREDRPPDRPPARLLRPRYRLRRDLLWLALVPAGTALYMGYLALAGGEPLMPFHAQDVWDRHFVGPYLGVWDGLRAGFDGVRQLLSMQRGHAYFTPAAGSPLVTAGHNVTLLAFLLLAIPAFLGTLRRLPFAYGAYAIAALALPLSSPVRTQPLMSLPRFLLVLFPLGMWLAAWLTPRPRAARAVLIASGLSLALFVGEFSTWHWVA